MILDVSQLQNVTFGSFINNTDDQRLNSLIQGVIIGLYDQTVRQNEFYNADE